MMVQDFQEIPTWIRVFKDIRILYLDHNKIQEIPNWIEELKELRNLSISFNKIQEIPIETLKKCDSLTDIWINNNFISKKEVKKAQEKLNIHIHNTGEFSEPTTEEDEYIEDGIIKRREF